MKGKLLQVYPSVIRETNGELEIDFDFCESVRIYLENFEQVSVACPIGSAIGDLALKRCRPVKELPWQDRIRLIPLPRAYDMGQFLLQYAAVRRLLKAEIERADYLVFHPHTLIGDWPTVGIIDAVKLRRRYAIDADIVYDKVAQVNLKNSAAWSRIIKKRLVLPIFQKSYRFSLKHSTLALLQGQDVFDAYARFCENPYKVYHAPVSSEDYITEMQLQKKLSGLTESRALRLCYVGRAIEMKGPIDWLKALDELIKNGTKINATWVGDGSLLPSLRLMAENLGIGKFVKFPGFVSDREEIRRTLIEADIFIFCHQTPESPRCLVEALAAGCALIGYGSAYATDLVADRGGGRFVEVGNWQELAKIVMELDKNRRKLGELIQLSRASGRLYERDSAMRRRVELIMEYL
jgi:glycosyltransferase involved in cell wall biosynthesis